MDVTDAIFSGSVSSNDNASWDPHAGYTGRGHTGFWEDGGKVEWNVQMSQAETTIIKFRYAAAPGGTAPLTLEVMVPSFNQHMSFLLLVAGLTGITRPCSKCP